ncbi:MAG: cation diffusion facilitator family transporter [Candidatus Gracilibacteria bacterium]|nr:cation diffusion facilitator family transporter [Candidatus Gracilibacteria bacterium]MDQ7023016.1 cation diffusion facilitator family transporter [Candidatus Gracilibacteria bacterium]
MKKSLEEKAPIIASSVALFLAIIKFIVGIMSGSVALLSSAVDSLLDTGVSIFNYFAIKFAKDPADREHNYGHGKMEAIAASIEGLIITLSGFYIIYISVNKIINPEKIEYINWTILVMIVSIIATGGLVYFLNSVYKKTNNLVIQGDSLHYKMDLFSNIAVIGVLIFLYFFPSLSWIDGIVGGLIGIYIIKEAYNLIQTGVNILLDTAIEEHSEIEKIIYRFVEKKEINGFHDLKTRSSGSNDKFIEFHLVLPPETTIFDSHSIGDKIEKEIKELNNKYIWNFIYHLDYYDDSKIK